MWPLRLLLIAAAALPQASADWDALLRAAGEAWAAGDYAGAASGFEAALEIRPGQPIALLNLSLARTRAGDLDGAIAALERLADTGLSFDLPEREWLAPLLADPRLPAVRERLAANGLPAGKAEEGLTVPIPDLFPEGVAWDVRTDRFWLSSVRHGQLLEVSPDGEVHRRIVAADPGWGVFGLDLSPQGRLWAAAAAVPQAVGYDESLAGRFALLEIDIETGAVLRRLLPPPGSPPGLLGDVTASLDGSRWATDSVGGALYRAAPDAEALEAFLPPGTFGSPQGLVEIAGGLLLVADYGSGLHVIDVSAGSVARVMPTDGLAPYGIDGLVARGRQVWAVQNGVQPYRVIEMRFEGDPLRIMSWRTVLAADPRLGEPTLAVLRGHDLWLVANSPWPLYADPENPPEANELQQPLLLRIPLDLR